VVQRRFMSRSPSYYYGCPEWPMTHGMTPCARLWRRGIADDTMIMEMTIGSSSRGPTANHDHAPDGRRRMIKAMGHGLASNSTLGCWRTISYVDIVGMPIMM
jgi:hypothetical protein